MKVITFSGIKGGIGKSSLAIMTSNYLSNIGKKVLCIDMDIQNSLTFYYFPTEYEESKNIAKALMNDDLPGNIIKDLFIDIIPSDFNLTKIRSLDLKTLQRIIKQVNDDYDYCIIDTAPTYDNIVLNAINTSDIVITPAYLTLFDLKALDFYKTRLNNETDKIDNWKILLNKYKEPKTDNPDTELNQYISLFNDKFNNILNTKIPDTNIIQKAIDTKIHITKSQKNLKLYNAISELCNELLNITDKPNQF